MKSYISRKFPLETRITDFSLAVRFMFNSGSGLETVAYYRDDLASARPKRRGADRGVPVAVCSHGRRRGACAHVRWFHRGVGAIGAGVRTGDRAHDDADLRRI